MYKNLCGVKLVYLLVGLMLLGGTTGCGTWDRKYYNFEPSPYDRAILRSMGKNPNVSHNTKPMIINGMKVEFKDEYLHIKDLNITIPYKDIQVSDADALGFARDVQKALRKRMNTARRVRLASSSIQLLTAAAAGSLGIIAHSDVETISALGAVSAIIPELQSIFQARGRSKAYGDGHDLIRQAVTRYYQKNKGNGKISTSKLTAEGSALMSEVAASIKAVDTVLQSMIPSVEDMKAATGQLENKFNKFKIVPHNLHIAKKGSGIVIATKDRIIHAAPKDISIVGIDNTQFGNNGIEKVTINGLDKDGDTVVVFYFDIGYTAEVNVKVGAGAGG